MKNIILLFAAFIISFESLAQVPVTSKELRLTNYTAADSTTSLGSAVGRVRYDPITGKFRFYNALTSTWFSYKLSTVGVNSLNALTGAIQTFATGTSGSDFAISSSGTAHTFNIPTASSSNRGLLSSADWTTFNNKGSGTVTGTGSADRIAYWTGASAQSFGPYWDNSNVQLGIGADPSLDVGVAGGGALQIPGTAAESSAMTLSRWANDTNGPNIHLGKSRGTTIGSYTVVQSGDRLGRINFLGADGTDAISPAAVIYAEVDGTPGSNDMPGRLILLTTPDGSDTPVERMRINSSGNIGIGVSPNAPLQFSAVTANRKIVMYEVANNDHEIYGFGVESGVGNRYQIAATNRDHVFYTGTSSTTSNELFRIKGTGVISTPAGGSLGVGITPTATLQSRPNTNNAVSLLAEDDSGNDIFQVLESGGAGSVLVTNTAGTHATSIYGGEIQIDFPGGSDDVTINNSGFSISGVSNYNIANASGTVSINGVVVSNNGSSTYTPTLTNTDNVAASTAYSCTYYRTGNAVTVSGKVDIDVTSASTATTLNVSLPVPSNFTTGNQGGGTAVCGDLYGYSAAIVSNSALDTMGIYFVSHGTDVANRTFTFQFTYEVIP